MLLKKGTQMNSLIGKTAPQRAKKVTYSLGEDTDHVNSFRGSCFYSGYIIMSSGYRVHKMIRNI